MYNKPQGITLFYVVIIEKNGGLFNLLTFYFSSPLLHLQLLNFSRNLSNAIFLIASGA